MKLPEQFIENMKTIVPPDEQDAFFASFGSEKYSGVRANTLRIGSGSLPGLLYGDVGIGGKVPWCDDGYYYTDGQPGRNGLYHAGVYYIQEPSAMYPAANVPLIDGGNVLDLCAAPGGKSTQLASRMSGRGLLVSNDISEERAKALVKNLQMAGAANAVVTNETPQNLARSFPQFFHTIVVDAPCSGEGMFRKDEDAVKGWEQFRSERCRAMQDEILESAHEMLRPGGFLSYSTCTFELAENEGAIFDFMRRHPEYEIVPAPKTGGVSDGIVYGNEGSLRGTARLWPHRVNGEGHFTAFLRKMPGPGAPETEGCPDDFRGIGFSAGDSGNTQKKRPKDKKKEKFRSFRRFEQIPYEIREYFDFYMTGEPPQGEYFKFGDNLYYLPVTPPNIDGLKVMMAGVYLGEIKNGEWKPSHRFALTMKPEDFVYDIILENNSAVMWRYLRGETVLLDDGDVCFTVNGENVSKAASAAERLSAPCAVSVREKGAVFIIGLGHVTGGSVKNLYPKGWRRFS